MPTVGRYEVLGELGQGGMAQVLRARDTVLEREVAIKLLHRGAASAGLLDEARTLAALNHPNIVTIYEIGEHEGQDFIAMEYLPGRSVRAVFDSNPPREQVTMLVRDIAIAVRAAHRAGILHRDIKPENAIVTATDVVKVVDFGIAHRLDRAVSRPSRPPTASEVVEAFAQTMPVTSGQPTDVTPGSATIFGTPAYMAPELLEGQPASEASDVYALGVTLYEGLAGRRPFSAPSLVELIMLVVEGSPPPPLEDPLADLVTRMLARDPAARPSLHEVEVALVQRLATQAPPPPAPSRRARTLIPIGIAALVLGGIVAWRVERAPAGAVSATVAVRPIPITAPSYGGGPVPESVAKVIGDQLRRCKGAQLQAEVVRRDETSAARYVVSGRIVEQGDQLVAEVDVLDQVRHHTTSLRRTVTTVTTDAHHSGDTIADLTQQVVDAVAASIVPGAMSCTMDDAARQLFASSLVEQGRAAIETLDYASARTYLEHALRLAPTSFEGWYALTLARSLSGAPESTSIEAADNAVRTAPTPDDRAFMEGVKAYLSNDFAGALAKLQPLLARMPAPQRNSSGEWPKMSPRPDHRVLVYFIGETYWHDGRNKEGFDNLTEAVDEDRYFQPARQHAWEYALVRRDVALARKYMGITGDDDINFASSTWDAYTAMRDAKDPWGIWARLVLGEPVTEDQEREHVYANAADPDIDRATYRIAHAAETGDRAGASRLFAEVLTTLPKDRELAQARFYGFQMLGEVLLAANLAPESRQLVTYLAGVKLETDPGFQRLASIAAIENHDASLLPTEQLNSRMTRLAAAARAAIENRHADAVATLDALVADPTPSWNFPERAALVEELRLLHRQRDLLALCRDSLHPPIFRPALLPLRRTCLLLAPSSKLEPPRGAKHGR